ncbi:hypothetical protein QPK87_25245 [Kamptonema cortianum]|nr:hypothetical protein [Kamptonema cortianum]
MAKRRPDDELKKPYPVSYYPHKPDKAYDPWLFDPNNDDEAGNHLEAIPGAIARHPKGFADWTARYVGYGFVIFLLGSTILFGSISCQQQGFLRTNNRQNNNNSDWIKVDFDSGRRR